MQIISTDVLDVVRIADDSVEGGTRLINACDLAETDQIVEEIAKGGRRTRKAAEPAAPESTEVAPEPAPADAEPQAQGSAAPESEA